MCGIVGYIGSHEATPVILEGLKRLEYRGYDSAGLAVINHHSVSIKRSEGKLDRLISLVSSKPPVGHLGIGHTRWATHGRPSKKNAHPHRAGRVVLVHNGIIENYQSLKLKLEEAGCRLSSETDSEIACHLIDSHVKEGIPFLTAFQTSLKELEGTYALAVLNVDDPDKLYVAKKGSPLVVGLGEGQNFIASDIPALLPHTKNVVFLEDGEVAVLTEKGVTYYGADQKEISKAPRQIDWNPEMAEKGGFKHFMLKEIFEQPRVVADTLMGRILKGREEINLEAASRLFHKGKFPHYHRYYIVACGTSWHAAMAGRYFIEAMSGVPVIVETASEFRYREPIVDNKTLVIAISQSGETADTLACIQEAASRGAKILSICNVIDSSIPRASDATLYTHAGPEIGVASTKAFTTQLVVLLLLSLYMARQAKLHENGYVKKAIRQLVLLPKLMEEVLGRKNEILKIAQAYYQSPDFYFLARGVHYPIALEGALKLKEISYIHAEGYAAGEMKHGPIALIERKTPVVALAPQDRVCAKMISNIEEVKARGASVIAIVTEGDDRFAGKCDHLFYIPRTEWYMTPILISLPLQLLAYFIADLKGTDVDQPRNLAKSVTVE